MSRLLLAAAFACSALGVFSQSAAFGQYGYSGAAVTNYDSFGNPIAASSQVTNQPWYQQYAAQVAWANAHYYAPPGVPSGAAANPADSKPAPRDTVAPQGAPNTNSAAPASPVAGNNPTATQSPQVAVFFEPADVRQPLGDAPRTRYMGDHTAPYQYARYYGRSLYRPYIYQPRMNYWYGTFPFGAYFGSGHGYSYPYASWYGYTPYGYSMNYPYAYSYYNYRPYYTSYPFSGGWAMGGYYGYPTYSSAGTYAAGASLAPYVGGSSCMRPAYSSYYSPSCTSYGSGAYNYGYRGNYYW